MTGQLLIDGVDAYTSYGVHIERNGWNGLLSFPSLKEPEKNDWQEYDGLEVDLSAPKLNSREFSLTLASDNAGGLSAFKTAIGGVHEYTCLGRTFKLRLVGQPSLTYAQGLRKFQVKFADDEPLDLSTATYTAPTAGTGSSDYYIGGLGNPATRTFANYGVRILSGSQAEIERFPEVKRNLLVNIPSQSGAEYDEDGAVHYQAKDVRLSCLMRAASLTAFWRNYDALLYDLVRPNLRTLNGLQCYYKSMNVSEFFSDTPWMKFSLTLCMVGGV